MSVDGADPLRDLGAGKLRTLDSSTFAAIVTIVTSPTFFHRSQRSYYVKNASYTKIRLQHREKAFVARGAVALKLTLSSANRSAPLTRTICTKPHLSLQSFTVLITPKQCRKKFSKIFVIHTRRFLICSILRGFFSEICD